MVVWEAYGHVVGDATAKVEDAMEKYTRDFTKNYKVYIFLGLEACRGGEWSIFRCPFCLGPNRLLAVKDFFTFDRAKLSFLLLTSEQFHSSQGSYCQSYHCSPVIHS